MPTTVYGIPNCDTVQRARAWLAEQDVDAASARAVMLAHPSVIKRPVVEWDAETVTVGFDPACG